MNAASLAAGATLGAALAFFASRRVGEPRAIPAAAATGILAGLVAGAALEPRVLLAATCAPLALAAPARLGPRASAALAAALGVFATLLAPPLGLVVFAFAPLDARSGWGIAAGAGTLAAILALDLGGAALGAGLAALVFAIFLARALPPLGRPPRVEVVAHFARWGAVAGVGALLALDERLYSLPPEGIAPALGAAALAALGGAAAGTAAGGAWLLLATRSSIARVAFGSLAVALVLGIAAHPIALLGAAPFLPVATGVGMALLVEGRRGPRGALLQRPMWRRGRG